jgi:uncharacterized protein
VTLALGESAGIARAESNTTSECPAVLASDCGASRQKEQVAMSSHGEPPQSEPTQPPQGGFFGGGVFIGPNGLRAGWRISIFIPIVATLGFALTVAASRVPLVSRYLVAAQHGQLAPLGLILNEAIVAFVVLAAAGIMSLIESRAPGVYGMPLSSAFGAKFWQGMLWGLLAVSLLVGLIAAAGAYSFGPVALSGSAILSNGILWLIGFLIVGVFEEFSFRGYLQYTLGSGIGFWPSAVILSALFGAVHLNNPGEGIIGALSVFAIAMFFCFTLRRTGNLWFAIGLHCSFDWGETFLYSVPNSGTTTTGALSHSALHGARWITGGTVGPEGSVFCFLTVALLFFVFHQLYPAKRA